MAIKKLSDQSCLNDLKANQKPHLDSKHFFRKICQTLTWQSSVNLTSTEKKVFPDKTECQRPELNMFVAVRKHIHVER